MRLTKTQAQELRRGQKELKESVKKAHDAAMAVIRTDEEVGFIVVAGFM